jgi:hypothetical protein
MRWRWARRRTPSGVVARAAARCVQCGEADDECGRGERDVEEEKDGRESELRALKVVAVVKEEVDAEAVEVKERSSATAPASAMDGGKCGEMSEERGDGGAGSWMSIDGGGCGASMCMAARPREWEEERKTGGNGLCDGRLGL